MKTGESETTTKTLEETLELMSQFGKKRKYAERSETKPNISAWP